MGNSAEENSEPTDKQFLPKRGRSISPRLAKRAVVYDRNERTTQVQKETNIGMVLSLGETNVRLTRFQ